MEGSYSGRLPYRQVCTTELGEVGKLLPEFAKRGVKVLALSSNTTESHNGCGCGA